MREVIDLLLANLDEAYERRGWHGTNLRGALRGLSAEDVVWRPGKGRHNIWELTLHAAYWKYAVRRKLTGAKRGSFPTKGSNWFASPAKADDASWREIVALLDREHRALREAVAALDEAVLRDPKKLRIVRGAAAHDLYHTGQIQLVKRLRRG